MGLRVMSRTSGVLPHTHTGKSGGQVQPRACFAKHCLTTRSSSEWKVITARRPPGRSRGDGLVHGLLHRRQLLVDRNADGLERALGRMLFFPPGGGRHGPPDQIGQLAGGGDGGPLPLPVDGGGDGGGIPLLPIFG